MKKENGSGGKFVFGAILGAITGVVAGVLFAPRSGKETRKIVSDKAGELKEKGKEYILKEEEAAKQVVKESINKITK